jgi:hypothetical protein
MKRTNIFVNKMHILRNILIVSIVLNLCNGQQPADKGANAKTKEILDYIAGLPKRSMFYFILNFYFYFSNQKINIFRVNTLELVVLLLI